MTAAISATASFTDSRASAGAAARRCRRRSPLRLRVRRRNDNHEFAAAFRRAGGVGGCQRREIAAANFFVQLGELAADRGVPRRRARTQDPRARAAMRGPVSNSTERRRNARELGDARAPLPLLRPAGILRRRTGRSAARATASAASTAEAPGSAVTRQAGLACGAHQLEAGIGDERRAGVGDERDGGAGCEPGDQLRPRFGGVVVVIGRECGRDPVVVE